MQKREIKSSYRLTNKITIYYLFYKIINKIAIYYCFYILTNRTIIIYYRLLNRIFIDVFFGTLSCSEQASKTKQDYAVKSYYILNRTQRQLVEL